jgi:Zinc carboxypeptidase
VRAPASLRLALLILVGFAPTSPVSAQHIPTPEEHFGFAMGASKKLARWDEILEYLTLIADESDRIRVDTVGSTTMGNPYVSVTMSAPANLARLDEIRASSARIAGGRLAREEAEALAADLPATAFINHNIHSTEIGASQTSVDLIYRLATATDEVTRAILDNVVTVLVPSANPDGQIMVTDWYRRNVGTEYERARMPWIYHYYAGHDNNRDYFQANLVETRYWMELMYHTTYPQLYLDQHQMGTRGPRIFVPPYPDPMNPDVHPLQWQQLRFIGGGMVADLQAADKQGVVTGAMYRIWGQEGALTGRYHNIVALLTETASARIASPDTVALEALERGAARGRGLSEYGFQMAFVDPWMGGEWRLQDIVDYQTVAAISFLEQAAKFREHYVMGRWQMASETIEKGEREGPRAYVIPLEQTDPITAADLVSRLILQGIQVREATEAFEATPATGLWAAPTEAADSSAADDETAADEGAAPPEPRTFPAGSWIVYGAQPARAAVLDLLEPRHRRLLHEWPGGPYVRSYDGAAYTMPMQMGVEVVRVDDAFVASTVEASSARIFADEVPEAEEWFAINAEVVRSYEAVNRLLEAGVEVSKAQSGDGPVFVVPASEPDARAVLSEVSRQTGLTVMADPADLAGIMPQAAARIGLYKGWAAAMDEGWTRYLLDEFEYPYLSLSNDDVRAGDLNERFDVIIIPSEIPLARLVNGADEKQAPPEYQGGIGDEGVEALEEFVEAGGTLVTFERADALVIERFGVPVRNAVADAKDPDFFLPSSLLRVQLDPDHPLAWGSPEEVAGKWAGGRAYEPTGFGGKTGRIRAVGRWADDPERVLMSGLLVGADLLAGKGAILDVEYGAGHILMYGFRVQHRAQTFGTFRLLFNALLKANPRTATEEG